MRAVVLFVVGVMLVVPVPMSADTLIVDPPIPEHFQTIQDAIDEAQDGDIVLIRPGVYQESFEVRYKTNITVRGMSEDPNDVTIVVDGDVVQWYNSSGTMDRMRFTNSGTSNVIALSISDVVIENLVVENTGFSASIYASSNSGCTTIVRNCLIISDQGTGIGCSNVGVGFIIQNNTIVGGAWGVTFIASSNGVVLQNNIIASAVTGVYATPSITLDTGCNDVWDCDTDWNGVSKSSSDFNADPLFCDPDLGDYTISDLSPCSPDSACGLVGALGIGCGIATSVPQAQIELSSWGGIKQMFR